jgi:hypothetical protein
VEPVEVQRACSYVPAPNCILEELGLFLRHAKLYACATCEVLAELLALKRFNSVKWPQRFSSVKTSWAKAIAVLFRIGEEFFEQ